MMPGVLANTTGFIPGRSALVELSGVLPLPPDNTPVEDLLEFKRKRSSELQRLQAAMDDIYLKITGSTDEQMAMQVAVRELDTTIKDLLKSSREWWKTIKLTDVQTLCNLGTPVALGALLGTSFQMPGTGAILGGVVKLLSIKKDIETKLKADRSSPYWYAVKVIKELG